jgi:hypothetical protein
MQVFMSGRMDAFMLLAMLWATVNAIPPALFFVYCWTKGPALRWCCTLGQWLSLLLGAGAFFVLLHVTFVHYTIDQGAGAALATVEGTLHSQAMHMLILVVHRCSRHCLPMAAHSTAAH